MKYNFDDLKQHQLTKTGMEEAQRKVDEKKKESVKKLLIQTIVTILVLVVIDAFIQIHMIIGALILAQLIGFAFLYLKLSTSGTIDEDTPVYRAKIVKFQKTLNSEMAGIQFSNQSIFYVPIEKFEYDLHEYVYMVYVNDSLQVLIRKL